MGKGEKGEGQRGRSGEGEGNRRHYDFAAPFISWQGRYIACRMCIKRLSNAFNQRTTEGKTLIPKRGLGASVRKTAAKRKLAVLQRSACLEKSSEILTALKWVAQNSKMYSKGMSIWCRMQLPGVSYRVAAPRAIAHTRQLHSASNWHAFAVHFRILGHPFSGR